LNFNHKTRANIFTTMRNIKKYKILLVTFFVSFCLGSFVYYGFFGRAIDRWDINTEIANRDICYKAKKNEIPDEGIRRLILIYISVYESVRKDGKLDRFKEVPRDEN